MMSLKQKIKVIEERQEYTLNDHVPIAEARELAMIKDELLRQLLDPKAEFYDDPPFVIDYQTSSGY